MRCVHSRQQFAFIGQLYLSIPTLVALKYLMSVSSMWPIEPLVLIDIYRTVKRIRLKMTQVHYDTLIDTNFGKENYPNCACADAYFENSGPNWSKLGSLIG